jgi:hypothetical protein
MDWEGKNKKIKVKKIKFLKGLNFLRNLGALNGVQRVRDQKILIGHRAGLSDCLAQSQKIR